MQYVRANEHMTGSERQSRSTARSERIDERFGGSDGPSPHWTRTLAGAGRLIMTDDSLRLGLEGATATRYSDAQIDDYSHLPASRYLWRPPLRMRVRARASHAAHPAAATAGASGPWLRGTAGFGFWNAPFTLAGGGLRAPEAVWFFAASPPSNMALTVGGTGYGWKAQVVHTHRREALAAAGPLALSALWARLSGDSRPAERWMQRLTGAREQPLDAERADLRQWHEYTLEWAPDSARFAVDGSTVLIAPDPPRGPLGFVAWIDNQYAVATPRGDLRFGALDCPPQWLDLATLVIEPM